MAIGEIIQGPYSDVLYGGDALTGAPSCRADAAPGGVSYLLATKPARPILTNERMQPFDDGAVGFRGDINVTRILDTIDRPAQLKKLTPAQLEQLAQEIRQEIIETVALRGGHLAPNLGTVELTLALHIAFDAPQDKLVWDIGHQAYPHKLLTGRRDRFRTIKQLGGISGYLRRAESEYDAFGASHASTSISAALGMATARDLKGETNSVVAIIGDGALTGGMALEAINNAGAMGKDLIVVLNDNDKSISDNVGALHAYLGKVRTDKHYRQLRETGKQFLNHVPGGGLAKEVAGRTIRSAKEFVLPSKTGVVFEELGFTYLGPFDGHNTQEMIEVFAGVKEMHGPILIQVITQKGRGCDFAERDATKFHGPGAYDPITGEMKKKLGEPPKYQDVFGDALVELAQRDSSIVGITAAMAEGTSLYKFQDALPERFFDVGIAEQHAVTFAAGLATEGMRPVAAIYSTFMQRAFDQVIHDVCVQNLHVVFPMDRAGLVGEDGHTQQGVFDIAFMRMIPNMRVMAPKDENELRHMLYTALYMDGPVALRYPRGSGLGVPMESEYPRAADRQGRAAHAAGRGRHRRVRHPRLRQHGLSRPRGRARARRRRGHPRRRRQRPLGQAARRGSDPAPRAHHPLPRHRRGRHGGRRLRQRRRRAAPRARPARRQPQDHRPARPLRRARRPRPAQARSTASPPATSKTSSAPSFAPARIARSSRPTAPPSAPTKRM